MKVCSECHNSYPDDLPGCPRDHIRETIFEDTPQKEEAPRQHWNLSAKQLVIFLLAGLAIVVAGNMGYSIYLARLPKPAPAIIVPDQDLQHEVERKLSESALFTGEKVSVMVNNRVVTLSGTVREDWKRTSAANIASSVPGVSVVKNGILLRETLQTPQPVWKSNSAAAASTPETAAQKRARRGLADPAAKVKELVAEGNYQVSQKNYNAAVQAYRAALALDASNYEAQSGLQEAQRLR